MGIESGLSVSSAAVVSGLTVLPNKKIGEARTRPERRGSVKRKSLVVGVRTFVEVVDMMAAKKKKEKKQTIGWLVERWGGW